MTEYIYCADCGKSLMKVEKVLYQNVRKVYCGECVEECKK